MKVETKRNFSLWTALLLAPVAWLVQFEISYALVSWSCSHKSNSVLIITPIIFLAFSTASVFVAWRQWQRSMDDDIAGKRARFMAMLGILLGSLFTLLIIAQGIPRFILSPCQF